MSLGSNGVDRVRSLKNIQTRLCVANICTSSAYFALSLISQPNYPKYTQIVQNVPKHDFWMQWGGSGVFVAKNFDATSLKRTFCTSSAHFALSFIKANNCPKYTRIVQNAPKYEFRVQWGGIGAFVAKNSDATLCYKLLH